MTTMRLRIDLDQIMDNLDQFIARLDAKFPVLEVDADEGWIDVDSSPDPDQYSVLMAAIQAAEELGLDSESLDAFVE